VQLLGTGINLPAEIGKGTASVVPAACFEAGVPSTLINQVAEEIRARGDPAEPWPLVVKCLIFRIVSTFTEPTVSPLCHDFVEYGPLTPQ
jgi:hypothetical protein